MEGLRWIYDRNPAGTDDRETVKKVMSGMDYDTWVKICGRIFISKIFDLISVAH